MRWKYTASGVIAWTIPHVAMVWAMVAGLGYGHWRMANIASFSVWLTAAAYAFVLYSDQATEIAKDLGPRVPPGFALIFDLALAYYFAAYGWFGHGAVYALIAAVSFIIFKTAELPSYPKEDKKTAARIERAVEEERARCLAISEEMRERQRRLNPGHDVCPFKGDMIEVSYRIEKGFEAAKGLNDRD